VLCGCVGVNGCGGAGVWSGVGVSNEPACNRSSERGVPSSAGTSVDSSGLPVDFAIACSERCPPKGCEMCPPTGCPGQPGPPRRLALHCKAKPSHALTVARPKPPALPPLVLAPLFRTVLQYGLRGGLAQVGLVLGVLAWRRSGQASPRGGVAPFVRTAECFRCPER
jgi:hypothetical protein